VGHLRSAGFDARIIKVQDLDAIKRKHGVTPALGSCHTAIVENYVVEGHVPADVIRKLLAERPDIVGIAVPDMPIGSPGMEVPGRPAESYDVLAFDHAGRVTVFASR
jgi:hypothetical protein